MAFVIVLKTYGDLELIGVEEFTGGAGIVSGDGLMLEAERHIEDCKVTCVPDRLSGTRGDAGGYNSGRDRQASSTQELAP